MSQTVQFDKNPNASGAAVRVSRVNATPSLSSETFTSWPRFGSASHKLVATASTIATVGLPNEDRPDVLPGQVWSAQAVLRNSNATSRQVGLALVFYDTAGATLGTSLGGNTSTRTLSARAIGTLNVTATAPAGTASVDVQMSRMSGSTSDVVHFDAVTLTRTPAGVAYRDPATNPFAGWSGLADASTQVYWDPFITPTPVPTNAPAPCITVTVDDLPPAVASLTLTRSAASRTHRVRGAVSVPVSSGFATQDLEAPFKIASTYQATMFDSSGATIGTVASATATLDVNECWVHNPLDPAGATVIDIADTSGKAITRPISGTRYQPQQRTVGVLITGRRRGIEGVELYFSTDDTQVAAKFEAMFGGYEDDDQQVPVLCIRATPYLDLPAPFFAGALSPTRHPINIHMGGTLREWEAEVDEVAPPFPGILVALLRRQDIDYAFATRNAMDAAYVNRLSIDRDYTKAGTAP